MPIFVIIGIFLNKGFKFQQNVCKRYHDLLLMSMVLSHIVILNIKNVDYCCLTSGISNSEALNLLQKADLNKRGRAL